MMKADDVLACQYSRWYPAYRHLAYRSQIVDLPQDFTDYLQQDGVFVDSGSQAVRAVLAPDGPAMEFSDPASEQLEL